MLACSVMRVSLEAQRKRKCNDHWLVGLTERFGDRWAKGSALHLCVSRAMRDDIERRFGIK